MPNYAIVLFYATKFTSFRVILKIIIPAHYFLMGILASTELFH